MGVATVSPTIMALAPGYVAVTWMVGGATSGYCAIGNWLSATPPTMMITTDRTVAKIGRSIKKWEITDHLLRQFGRGVGPAPTPSWPAGWRGGRGRRRS